MNLTNIFHGPVGQVNTVATVKGAGMDIREIMGAEDYIHVMEGSNLYGPYSKEVLEAAQKTALDALRKQVKHKGDEPLTPEEVEAIPDGEPVFIILYGVGKWGTGWSIKGHTQEGQAIYVSLQGEPKHNPFVLRLQLERYGTTWIAYRTRPERRQL